MELAVTRTYRIRRVESGDAVIDLRSVLRRVLGIGGPAPAPQSPQPDGSVSFTAIVDRRPVGSMTQSRPNASAGIATLQRLEAEHEHQASGCREALLDVAVRWASANDCGALAVSAPAGGLDFYLANGFHIVREARELGSDPPATLLSLPLAGARPHSDAWFSKCHGAWFASVVRH